MSALLEAAAVLNAHRADLAVDAVVVSFGSHGPTRDCMIDHYTVEVVADGVTYSAGAKHPHDAAALAKLKVRDAREAKARKAAKARGDA